MIESAQEVHDNWRNTLFGGNSGITKIYQQKSTGIVKHIYQDLSEEDLVAEITATYPDSELDFFKKNDEFTGTLKIKFKDEETLENAIKARLTIRRQKYMIEEYKYQPKVIICNRCLKFGHVQRLCNSTKPKCAKCSQEHETKDCVVERENYKCAHCSKNHITGDKTCEIMRNKMSQLVNRYNV